MKLGIIGTNFISDRLVEAAKEEGVLLSAVYSRTEESGSAFAQKHGIPQNFTDYKEFLKCGIDAVYVASPNALHYSQSKEALLAGLSVLCEKPAVPTVAQYRELVSLAKERGLVFLEAMRPAHDPSLALIREQLPRLGKIRHAVFEYCQYSSRYDAFLAGDIKNAFNPALCNAAVMDIGVYPIHTCIRLFGMPKDVTSHSIFLSNGFEGEGIAHLIYDEMQVDILYSKITQSVRPSVITGEYGSLCFDVPNTPQSIVLCLRGQEEERLSYTPVKNNMIYELREFARLHAAKEADHPHLLPSEQTIAVIERICASSGIRF